MRPTPPVARHRGSSTPSPRTLIIAGLFTAVGLSYIGPVSGYWSTRSTLRAQETALTRLQDERARLSGQLAELKQPQILEIKAREIGMLRPGEQGYVIDFYTPKPKPKFRVEMVPPRRSRPSS